MQKNGEYTGVVQSFGTNGEGIIKLGEYVAFVPYCIVGEEIRFKALQIKGNVVYGKLLNVLTPSPYRRQPICNSYYKCGGCQLQHISYDGQLNFKRQTVKNTLYKIGGISAEVSPCVSCGELRYRNKLVLPIGVDSNGENVVGFYAERSHRIVKTDDCAIQSEWIKNVINAIYSYMNYQNLKGFDDVTRKGDLRRIVAREIDGKFIFVLVAARRIKVELLLKELDKNFKNYTLYLNINAGTGNVIFGKDWHICRGEGFFEAEDCSIKFKAGANTFLQVNDSVRRKLYAEVVKEAGKEGVVAIDLYSGGGMLTAMLAKSCGQAYGIEIVKEATVCADELKILNGLHGKMTNICGKVEDEIQRVFAMTQGKERVIVCDPPRKGMERSVIKAILNAKPNKIVLVSCNPSTLARDLGLLCGSLVEKDGELTKTDHPVSDYKITKIIPFDMFPQTKHVETLVCLSKKTEKHISIDVEFGEGEGQVSLKKLQEELNEQKPKKKTTYKDIQAYVEEKYGFKVHTAYIAEVKRDLGLPMYDAPNSVEELKRPRSHPTTEMIEAIKDALKNFEII